MRVGKKAQTTVGENKKTRSCMVRMEKVRSSPGDSPDEKQLKGPLKKRPITQIASPTTTKPKEKMKNTQKYEEELYEAPPTIAAGRSRRAIKPNPKYASEDIVTPRIIKKKGTNSGKLRKSSESSDDFFNKDSGDELDDMLLGNMDKNSDVDEKHFEDYDSSDMLIEETPKPRGRPRKNVYNQLTYSASSETSTRTGANTKVASQSQLVQLRKSMSAGMRPSPTQILNLKRKMESDDLGVTNKRFLYSSRITNKPVLEKDTQRLNENQNTKTRTSVSGQMPNGSKIIVSHESDDEELSSTVSNNAATGLNSKSAILQRRSPTARLLTTNLKQRSSSPTIRKLRENSNAVRNSRSSPQLNAGDESDAMPTFTIVNINDIINKKGDVLISKSGEKTPVVASTMQDRLTRRKIGNNSASTERGEGPKKQTILNHTLLNKSAANLAQTRLKVSSVSSAKPAPRILNSMVAKRMQLVKPKIANLDDSADETFSLSLDDDEEMEQEDAKTFSNVRKLPVFSKKTSPTTKLATTSTATNKLATIPVVNNNRLPVRKAPEQIDISREGDKIIKKVTCYGTWYVVNPSTKRPVTIERNVFDGSLIELANRVEEIKLPSDQWSNKVTLYEMSPTTSTKSNPTTVYTGDLSEHNIPEENRYKYQVSCVMFRRAVNTRYKSRLPYDRAVIFKNKTFFTNIEGKNVKLIAAPSTVTSHEEIEILLEIVDSLTLQSSLVEPATTVQ